MTDTKAEKKAWHEHKGLILPWGSNQYSNDLTTRIQVMGCFDPHHVVLGEVYLLHSLMNHILKYFLYQISCIQPSFRQIIFTVVSITLDSVQQKCKTNTESSVSCSSTLSSRKGLLCNLLRCLSVRLNFSHDSVHIREHARMRSLYVTARMRIHVPAIDSHSQSRHTQTPLVPDLY